MTAPEPTQQHAYTRAAVDAYERSVGECRAGIEQGIASANARTRQAEGTLHRLRLLERAVGEWIVARQAQVLAHRRGIDPSVTAPAAPAPVVLRAVPPVADHSLAPDGFGPDVAALPDRDADDYFEQLQSSLGAIDGWSGAARAGGRG